MIKPTVGRIVWYTPSQNDKERIAYNDQPLAAIVVYVHQDGLVKLAVFDANGDHHTRGFVPLLQDDDARPEDGFYCEWMPYQKGQAAKTESLEQQLKERRA